MVRKTKKRRGGMIRAFGRPLGKASIALGESVGKDYLQKKSVKIANGVYDDSSLVTNPKFLMTGIKPLSNPNLKIYNKENVNDRENVNPNINVNGYNKSSQYDYFGGRTNKRINSKKRKTRKNKK
jgi:hypothetical protein